MREFRKWLGPERINVFDVGPDNKVEVSTKSKSDITIKIIHFILSNLMSLSNISQTQSVNFIR